MMDATSDDRATGPANWHAIDRAWERYGVDLTKDDLFSMERSIYRGESVCLTKHAGDGAERHLVKAPCGTVMIAIYDPLQVTIRTILPPGHRTARPSSWQDPGHEPG